MRLLIVEDEPDLASALQVGLRRDGYAVDAVGDGAGAIERLMTTPYDLVCLDLGLPDVDGRDLCRRIRSGELAVPNEPPPRVIMLTARNSLADRVGGLDDGADDYLSKPFSFEELTARIRALLRRDSVNPGSVIRIGALELDAARYEARRYGQRLDLTPKEFALLRYMMLHPGQVLTPERLLEHVWDEQADPFSNTVRVTMSNLRRKLAATSPAAAPHAASASHPAAAAHAGHASHPAAAPHAGSTARRSSPADVAKAPGDPSGVPTAPAFAVDVESTRDEHAHVTDQPIETVTGVGYRLLETG